MSRLTVVHRTAYRYDAPVSAGYDEARVTPPTTPRQTVLHAVVDVEPVTWRMTYWDYWGTLVTAFEVLEPHQSLEVLGSSSVEVDPAPPLDLDGGPPWEAVRDPRVVDREFELLAQTERTRPDPEVAELAERLARDLPPAAAALALCQRVREEVAYVPGATAVRTSAAEAWGQRRGVCQDLAHIVVGGLRAVGLPARYVSGYVHPDPSAPLGEPVRGESHAWVEWWAGEWTAFDPTNGVPVGEQHVFVARGRDYADVVPIKGVFAGSASSTASVDVEVTRSA